MRFSVFISRIIIKIDVELNIYCVRKFVINNHVLIRFPICVTELCNNIVQASIQLHHRCAQMFLPTAVKFHYIFNLRDLSNCFQGLLFSGNECLQSSTDLMRLWFHETQRVYGDKLIDEKDIESFSKLQLDILKKNVEEIDESAILEKPNIYCHFAGKYFLRLFIYLK